MAHGIWLVATTLLAVFRGWSGDLTGCSHAIGRFSWLEWRRVTGRAGGTLLVPGEELALEGGQVYAHLFVQDKEVVKQV